MRVLYPVVCLIIFAFNGRRWPESFSSHSSNWFLGPVELRIVLYLFIYLLLLTLSLSSSSPLFYQDRWVWCVFILQFASFSASQPVWSSRGVRFIVQWKYIFLSSVRIGRAHLASNQCLMVTLGDGEADLIQSISDRQPQVDAYHVAKCVFQFIHWNWSFTGESTCPVVLPVLIKGSCQLYQGLKYEVFGAILACSFFLHFGWFCYEFGKSFKVEVLWKFLWKWKWMLPEYSAYII